MNKTKYELRKKSFGKGIINTKQIGALLWKDILVRKRQPWLTLLQYVWPLFVFMVLYFLRLKYGNEMVENCQFPTRMLPSEYKMLSVFQSYICTVDNECISAREYEETPKLENAPVTPLLNLVQTFINEPLLMEAIMNLPKDKNIFGAISKIYAHKKFKDLQHSFNLFKDQVSVSMRFALSSFDMKNLWSDSSLILTGKLLCGRPFKRTTNRQGWMEGISYKTEDAFNKDEIESMPTPHCKQLYKDVAGSPTGKMTWSILKPIIQGKIVYGPENSLTDEIMSQATAMFKDVTRLQQFAGALNQLFILLRTDSDFQIKVKSFLDMARKPFIQKIIGKSVDIDTVEKMIEFLKLDDTVSNGTQAVVNLLECFSTDRLVKVTTEAEMNKRAFELNEKKMFHSCIYFKNVSSFTDREYSYKIRMAMDSVPITIKNRNQFFYPGPNDNFDLGMKYHRGFIQLQYSVDRAIIKTIRHHETLRLNEERALLSTPKSNNESRKEESLRAKGKTAMVEKTNLPLKLPAVLPTTLPEKLPAVLPGTLSEKLLAMLPTTISEKLRAMLPATKSEKLPETLSEKLPAMLPAKISETLPTVLPTTLPEKLPTVLPTTLPEKLPEVLPTTLPEKLSAVLPATLPEQVPAVLPATLSEKLLAMLPTTISEKLRAMSPATKSEKLLAMLPTTISEKLRAMSPATKSEKLPAMLPATLSEKLLAMLPTTISEKLRAMSPATKSEKLPAMLPATISEKLLAMLPTTISEKLLAMLPTTISEKLRAMSPATKSEKLPAMLPATISEKLLAMLPATISEKLLAMLPTTISEKLRAMSPATKSEKLPAMLPATISEKLLAMLPTTISEKLRAMSPATKSEKLPAMLPATISEKLLAMLPATISEKLPTVLPTTLPEKLPTVLPTTLPEKLPEVSPTTLPEKLSAVLPATLPELVPAVLPATLSEKLLAMLPTTISEKLRAMLPATKSAKFRAMLPATKSEKLPETLSEKLPAMLPAKISETLPTVLPTTLPEKLPTVLPTTLPEKLPEVLPTTLPEKLSAVLPATLPEQVPAVLPATLSEKLLAMLPTTISEKLRAMSPATKSEKLLAMLPTTISEKLRAMLPATKSAKFPVILPSEITLPSHEPEDDDDLIYEFEDTVRRRRAPINIDDFDFNEFSKSKPQEFHGDQFEIYTKQFPYPKYKKDNYEIGIYVAQSIQLAFFLALTVQVSAAVRHRIWTKESGNSTLMRIMGLRKSSEYLTWIITNMIELLLIFTLCLIVMYAAKIVITTSAVFLCFFLILFGICMTSFCYMVSTFFSTATIGAATSIFLLFFTYLPYIIIVTHDTKLAFASRLLANLSMSTAFCSAWRHIIRYELQQKDLSFNNAFSGATSTNDLKLGIFMLLVDTVLYAIIGYLYERFTYSDFKFHKVPAKVMDISIGGLMENVSKTYDGQKPAVNDVSIVFRRDHVTCLLGQNGAGKSTIIKLLTGQITKSSGEILLPLRVDQKESNDTIGLCPQNNILIPNLTAKEHLELYASIKVPDRYSAALKETMKSLHFGNHINFRCENLSGGLRRRLTIAIAFIGSPNLVILDEPCSGVDDKSRKQIWQLIGRLKKGRAVILATHFLDEAEHLGDNVIILKDGEVKSENQSKTLRNQFTKSFDIQIKLCPKADRQKSIDDIQNNLKTHAPNFTITHQTDDDYHINIPYCNANDEYIDFEPMIKSIEKLHKQQSIHDFRVISKDLAEIFTTQTARVELEALIPNDKDKDPIVNDGGSMKPATATTTSQFTHSKNLFWKRFVHFRRNYRLILLILIVPAIFNIIAMQCMISRPTNTFDSELVFSQQLYGNSTEFYTYQHSSELGNKTLAHLKCQDQCEHFNSSKQAFRWILDTHDDFIDRRYGGITLNGSKVVVWYNNKGLHSMPVYLNALNSALFKSEMGNGQYKITTSSHPLLFETKDWILSAIFAQLADAALAIVLIIAFSMVVTSSSVYIVNERVSGEKLQQRLCNVAYPTYWGVSFVWDFSLYLIALLIAMGILKAYDIAIYTANDNLYGICLLIFMYGLAMIPMVHLAEKLFYDASMANMYILCLNIVISFTTVITIVLFDVLGESEETKMVRNVLNRLFLVFPQHAFADGVIEICKNYITADVFSRFDIYTYKSPIASTLLLPHLLSLLIFGLVFVALNYLIENGHVHQLMQLFSKKPDEKSFALTSVYNNQTNCDNILVVKNLCKMYRNNHHALDNVSFNIAGGECFGLLGVNGAGKSTIFSILSGQIYQSSGSVQFLGKKGISYCPQTNALDDLLTVEEIISFYGQLRGITDIEQLTTRTLKSFHLEQYRKVLVKNLSGRNRRKLSVAVACFGDTRLVLMDEPTSDMDPITRALVYKAVKSLIAAKRSVILTSHTISEIEPVCHRVGVMRAGKIISVDSPIALKERFGRSYLVKLYYNHVNAVAIERYVMDGMAGLQNVIINNDGLQFNIKLETGRCDSSNGAKFENRILLSDLFRKLYILSLQRTVTYTISECLLDQVIQQVLETESHHSYSNPVLEISESQLQEEISTKL